MQNNPMQMMQLLNQFMSNNKNITFENAEQLGREKIRNANLNQNQLDMLQKQANFIYSIAQKFNIFK